MITNEDLIPLVYSKPEIWDQNSLHYTSKEVKMAAWTDIAEKLSVSADSAKGRWTNLRDLFRRELKKTLKMARETGDPDAYVPRWKHFRTMLFLKDQIVKDENLELPSLAFNDTFSLYPQTILEDGENIKVEESFEVYSRGSTPTSQADMVILPATSTKRHSDSNSDDCTTFQKFHKRQRKDPEGDTSLMEGYAQFPGCNEMDEDYYFVMSILPSIRRIRQDKKTSFKMKVFKLLMEEEGGSTE